MYDSGSHMLGVKGLAGENALCLPPADLCIRGRHASGRRVQDEKRVYAVTGAVCYPSLDQGLFLCFSDAWH